MLGPKLKHGALEFRAISCNDCVAKTIEGSSGGVEAGIDVFTHCKIVGEVAKELLTRMPRFLREAYFPAGVELISAAHDVGKVSPAFQKMLHQNLTVYNPNFLEALKFVNPENAGRGKDAHHATVSQAGLEGSGRWIPEIVGCHHGDSPPSVNKKDSEIYGGPKWQEERDTLIKQLKEYFQTPWPSIGSSLQASVVAGLTTVADWIGSGQLFENYHNENWKSNVPRSLDLAGYIYPKVKKGLSFEEVFGFSERPAQSMLIQTITQSGVYVLEAPMGLGKTEAALYAAYKILEADKATGIYFALPTQLTSNKIYERVSAFLDIILDNSHRKRAHLVHGASWMYGEESEMGEEGQPGRSWFDGRKRGLLAPFAVGTIDQALMAVMNVKHGFVRTFGLAGKVVILDEVHTYDSYTGTILDNLVTALRSLQCTVIILSATLTQERRAAILGQSVNGYDKTTLYPLITSFPLDGASTELGVPPEPNKIVLIHLESHDPLALEEALLRSEQGQQVLWIENTVAEAQEIYKVLASRGESLNVEVGLVHSRFLKSDREEKEGKWVNLFGKEGAKDRKVRGRILVGTQVLEQSLDIDSDFLITRLAPTDMILQRLGRLWRHEGTWRPKQAKRECWILSPTLQDVTMNYKQGFGISRYVYDPFVLWRTLETWETMTEIALPGDIRSLIEATYLVREEVGEPARLKQELTKKKDSLSQMALVGLSKMGTALPETAATRYSDQETCEILLIRTLEKKTDGVWLGFTSGNKILLPKDIKNTDRTLWRKISREIARNTLTVSEKHAPLPILRKNLSWLKDFIYLGNEDDSLIRVALVQDSGEVVSLNSQEALPGFTVSYSHEVGYKATKEKTTIGVNEGW